MIRFLTRSLIAVAALTGLVGTANAALVPATWTDNVAGNQYIGQWTSYSYVHDLTDNGANSFRPLDDVITNFSLSINLFDDQDRKGEWATVKVADVLGFGNTYSFDFDTTNFNHGTTLLGLVELNALGSLSVTINSLYGDFYFGGSKLVAGGVTDTRQVPEPETLAMFGIGLVGVAAAARRRKAKNA
ncbi:MAG TPA: PEP-CTERM sorting domain-containing protein [Steroidobacteraceae bacterium]|nr:PEP-CTERM sorting domain-containing protein [Steroidobacteraceae bacterium]